MEFHTKDIVRRFLYHNVQKRLGSLRNGTADVRNHPFLNGLDMNMLQRMRLPTPYTPPLKDALDMSNFMKYEDPPDDHYEEDGTGWADGF